jgi:UDP-N-acetylglucosamine 1-carboxyvinyltransferase
MAKFIINGGKQLKGEITVAGSKNAIFPLFAAALLTDEPCRFTNVPEIQDKQVMVDLIKDLGAEVEVSDHSVLIKAGNLSKSNPDATLTSKLRGSIVLLGALLGRTGKVTMTFPGGDLIGKRPIDAHLASFKALGATVSSNGSIALIAEKLVGNKIVMEESSVTATENTILASVLAEGQTIIKLAAMEPHVQQLGEFLNKMGAQISGIGTTTIIIDGVKKLRGAEIELIPDSNEAASFIALAAAAKADVMVKKLEVDFLEDFLLQLKKMKVNFVAGADFVHVFTPTQHYESGKIQCGLYPKLASDDVPSLAVLATQATGESLVYEWLYENRLGYIDPLIKMGATAQILDPHRVRITGPTPLTGDKITSYDLRMGITLIIAALIAKGESEIDGIEHVDRGYEKLEKRLAAIGANIKRID